ncbi:MAG TPA: flagellar M-ring protein FliF [Arcobacter sp.]|nr:flagellar M-ring protein FliF [Arcobacter sp.]HIP55937.1 flagellar M-ring protein FliF [Arcobacter sp.]
MQQIFNFVNNLSAAQRAVIIGGFSILFVFLIGLLVYSSVKAGDAKLNYTIATNLTKNQIMLASNELEAAGIPFAIVGNGNSLTLRTSKKNVNIAKIKLVTSEAITNKHTGWEIFDKSSLGTTNFENNVKYLRAMEGELSRSLEALSGVMSATVKIAIPKESVFTQRRIAPTASAILSLRDGTVLTQKQISGIKNFISSAVPKLLAKNIKLINQNGSILEQNQEDLDSLKFISHEKYKIKLESDYEDKIITLLEPFIGQNRVVARVTIALDFKNQVIEQEIYEPEGTIRSQQTTESTSAKEAKEKISAGVPGIQSNIQNVNEDDGELKSTSSNEEAKNIINYEISKKSIRQKDNAFARIDTIKAAVTFDSSILEKIDNKDEYLANIKLIIEESVGLNTKRGDRVTVKAFKFIGFDNNGTNGVSTEGGLDAGMATKAVIQDYGEYIQYLISAILLFLFYKKFIASNEIDLSSSTSKKTPETVGVGDEDFDFDTFNPALEKNKLKNKVRNQILSNIDGLDQETMVRYEILVEELDTQINNHPDEMAKMIELLLSEGESKLKQG